MIEQFSKSDRLGFEVCSSLARAVKNRKHPSKVQCSSLNGDLEKELQ
jgi:hypothetical protein